MTYAISIEWERCQDGIVGREESPDGAERVALDRDGPDFGSKVANQLHEILSPPIVEAKLWLQYRTERRETYVRRLDGLKNLLVTEYVNAKDSESLIEFVRKYGFPAPGDAIHIDDLIELQVGMRNILVEYNNSSTFQAAADFRTMAAQHIADIKPDLVTPPGTNGLSLTLVPDSLQGFMLLEAASVMTGGALVMKCAHCGAIFVSGSHTGRRKTAHYCSNRCRVAAQRA